MQKINPTVVVIALIAAVTILAAVFMVQSNNQPAPTDITPTETGDETPTAPVPTEEEPAPEPDLLPPAPSEDKGGESVACTMDAMECPDGSYVGRVPPSCEFAECPPPEQEVDKPVVCTMDVKECPDGSYVGRQGPNCEFAPCPVAQMNFQLQP